MKPYSILNRYLFLLLLLFLADPGNGEGAPLRTEKTIISQACTVRVEELGLDFMALVDTGSTSTSLHATDYLIEDESDDPRDNVGKDINFLTVTDKDEYKRMTAEIVKLQTVSSAQGKEKRYVVKLTLSAKGIKKSVFVNLRDRSHMRYKLLMGRDWLADDFLVEVASETESMAEEGEVE